MIFLSVKTKKRNINPKKKGGMEMDSALIDAVFQALRGGGVCRIAVHSEEQAEAGDELATRLAFQIGGRAKDLTFKVISEEQQANLPVGLIFAETHS